MARTGRFGRLPTAAPDLSSQIAAMIEKYQNARDKNIYAAWSTPGGRFEGKKVTDADLLAYYKSRRDDYEPGDPEYDEWDSRIHQLAFEVSDQRVGMLYANGRIKAGDVANHYRRWARQMPKNSAVYRDLMSRAGQFAKTQRAARKAKVGDGNWKRFMGRWNNIEDEYVKPAVAVIDTLTNVARAGGLIGANEDIFSMTSQEMGNLDDLLALVNDDTNSEDYKALTKGLEKAIPGWKAGDPIDLPLVTRLVKSAQHGMNMQIDLAKGYKGGDLSSWVQNRLNEKANLIKYRRLEKRQDIVDQYMEAHNQWNNRRAMSGSDVIEEGAADPAYREALVYARKRARAMKDWAMVGQLDAEIKGLDGDFTSLIGVNVTFLWEDQQAAGGGSTASGAPTTAETFARNQYNRKLAIKGVIDGTHYVTERPPADPMEQTGLVPEEGTGVLPFPQNADGTIGFGNDAFFPIPRVHTNDDGSMVPYTLVVEGEPYYVDLHEGEGSQDAQGNPIDHTPVLIGYVATYDGGVEMTKIIDPATGDIRVINGNAFTGPGVVKTAASTGGGWTLTNDRDLNTPVVNWQSTITKLAGDNPATRLEDVLAPEGPMVPNTPTPEEEAAGGVFHGLSPAAGDYIDYVLNDEQRKLLRDAGLTTVGQPTPDYDYYSRFVEGVSMQQVADVLAGTGDRTGIADIQALQPAAPAGYQGNQNPPPAVGNVAPDVPAEAPAEMRSLPPEQPDPAVYGPGSPEYEKWQADVKVWTDQRVAEGVATGKPVDFAIWPDPGPQPENPDPMIQLKWKQDREFYEAGKEHRKPRPVTLMVTGGDGVRRLLTAQPNEPVQTGDQIKPRAETVFDPETGKITRYNQSDLPPGWEPTSPEPQMGPVEQITSFLSGGVGGAIFDLKHQQWVEEQWRQAEAAGATPHAQEVQRNNERLGIPAPLTKPDGTPLTPGRVESVLDRALRGISEGFEEGRDVMDGFDGLTGLPVDRPTSPDDEEDDDLLVLDDQQRLDLSSPVFRTWATAQLDAKGPQSFRSTTLAGMARDPNTRRAMLQPQFMATWIRQMMNEGQIPKEELVFAVEEIDDYYQWRDATTELEAALKRGQDGTWQTNPFNITDWVERRSEARGPMIKTLEKDYPGLLMDLMPGMEVIDQNPNSPNYGKPFFQGTYQPTYNPSGGGSDAIPARITGAPTIPFGTRDPRTGQQDAPGSVFGTMAPPEPAPEVSASPKSLKIPDLAAGSVIGAPPMQGPPPAPPPDPNVAPPSLPPGYVGRGPSGGLPGRPPTPLRLPTLSSQTPSTPPASLPPPRRSF